MPLAPSTTSPRGRLTASRRGEKTLPQINRGSPRLVDISRMFPHIELRLVVQVLREALPQRDTPAPRTTAASRRSPSGRRRPGPEGSPCTDLGTTAPGSTALAGIKPCG